MSKMIPSASGALPLQEENAAEDHLTSLPSEVLHLVFDYLFYWHWPDKALPNATSQSEFNIEAERWLLNRHALDCLAGTCKVLRAEVNDWAIHLMTRHSDVTKFSMPKTAKKDRTFNMLRGRNGLLTWAYTHCIFCGKISHRSAILMNGLRCCAKCDRREWPEKITKTEALKQYDLKEHHLLPHLSLKPPGPKLPKIRYGTYMSQGCLTTMFLQQDVVRVATALHGDLEGHLARRKANNEERKLKREEKKRIAREAKDRDVAGSSSNPLEIA